MEIANKTVYDSEDLRRLVEATFKAACEKREQQREQARVRRPGLKTIDDLYASPKLPRNLRVGYYHPKPSTKDKDRQTDMAGDPLPVVRATGRWDKRPRLGIAPPENMPLPPLLILAHASTADDEGLERKLPPWVLETMVYAITRIFDVHLANGVVQQIVDESKVRFRSLPKHSEVQQAERVEINARIASLYEKVNIYDDQIERAERRINKAKDERKSAIWRIKELEKKRDRFTPKR